LNDILVPGVVECYKIVTEEKSKRVAKFAFDYATKHGRKKVTGILSKAFTFQFKKFKIQTMFFFLHI